MTSDIIQRHYRGRGLNAAFCLPSSSVQRQQTELSEKTFGCSFWIRKTDGCEFTGSLGHNHKQLNKIEKQQGGQMQIGDFRPTTKRKKWGLGLFIFGIFGVASGLSSLSLGPAEGALVAFSYLGVSAGGLFLILTKPDPARVAIKAAKDEAKAKKHQEDIERLLEQLKNATGASAVLLYQRLEALILDEKQPETYKKRLQEALESINFDQARIQSRLIGSVTSLEAFHAPGTHSQVRIFKDWVIAGNLGYNFDVSTRGQVHLDGVITLDLKGSKVDTRTASLQLATQDWSQSFSIKPSEADEARRILNQLLAIVEQMKPKSATALDVESAMERLASKSGKSQAERLEELSNLRYQRLLSDQEFEKAKTKILEI